MHLQSRALVQPVKTILLRLVVWLPFGILFNLLVIENWLHLDIAFQAAVMTMIILPPPFVIPLFMKKEGEYDNEYVISTLSLATLVTLVAFSLISIVYLP